MEVVDGRRLFFTGAKLWKFLSREACGKRGTASSLPTSSKLGKTVCKIIALT